MKAWTDRLFQPVDIAWLVFFRIAFGLLMCEEALRYLFLGYASELYIEPAFHFTYLGFDWVKPWPGIGMYVHFGVLAVLALALTVGFLYRLSAALFFLGFTYVCLLDQARYLNHFYLVGLICFLMIFFPAHRSLSVDARLRPRITSPVVPAWTLWLFRAQIFIVYFYAGIAKLNGDWLQGQPLLLWLAKRTDHPLLGPVLAQPSVAYLMSYGGVALDLVCGPLLLWRRTRVLTFTAAVTFHLLNFLIFSIGIFPWFMIVSTLMFFDSSWPRRLFKRLRDSTATIEANESKVLPDLPAPSRSRRRLVIAALSIYVAVQVLVPLRHFLYPGNVNWTEEGHRFSWRMKLRSKEGWCRFSVKDPTSGRVWSITPELPEHTWKVHEKTTARPHTGAHTGAAIKDEPGYLTARQVRKMCGVPDMLIQFVHHLAEKFRAAGYPDVEIRARVRTSLNGRRRQLLVDPDVDLAAQPRSLAPATWILPLTEPLRHEADVPLKKATAKGARAWRKHTILSVKKCFNVVAADFTGDGLTDVMANKFDATMLLVAPDWKLVEVENTRGIHVYASDAMDIDADGDLDYVAGRYSPGLLFWLECPEAPAKQPWPFHLIDDQPDGVHGILLKDLDGDGRLDMVTNSAHRDGPLPQSILWYQVPQAPRDRWQPNVLGKGDAAGRPHYFTSGDFNADGRLDVALASSGVALPGGDWLAWWEAPAKRTALWKKHPIADGQVGATHLLAADFNGDKRLDFIASMGHGRGVYWFEAPEWKRNALDSTLRDVHCLVAVDLDADGDVDAATVSRKDFVAAWFENDGQGRFTQHVIDAKQSAYDLRAADMDRDGDLDLVVAGAESDNVVWLENPSR